MGDVRRLIVFDLDGTLIDSRRDLADAANALIVERGGRELPEDAIGRMVGEGAAMLIRRALTAAGLSIVDGSVERFLELYDERLLCATRPYPGIPEALDRLAGRAAMAVLTNKPIAPTRRLLDAFDLSRFLVAVIGGDGPFARKPDPSALLHLVSSHATSAQDTVLVGDSRIDVMTARAAGTAMCVARYGFGFDSLAAGDLSGDEMFVDEASQLPAVLSS